MREFAYTVNLKDDPSVMARYRAEHREVWPEVVASLRQEGVRRLRIFLLGRRLFMLIEAADDFDPAAAFARHRARGGRIIEWETLMDGMQERVPEAPGDGKWAMLEKICDF